MSQLKAITVTKKAPFGFSKQAISIQLVIETLCDLLWATASEASEYLIWKARSPGGYPGGMALSIEEAPFFDEVAGAGSERFDLLLRLVLGGYGWIAERHDAVHYDVYPR